MDLDFRKLIQEKFVVSKRVSAILASLAILVLFAFCWSSAVEANFWQDEQETPTANPLKAKVEELMQALESDELSERTLAEKSLLELGPDALLFLDSPPAGLGNETKAKLQRIRTSIETRVLDQMTKASQVTLKGEFSLVEALTEIEKQSGNMVVGVEADTGEKFKFDFEKRSYWYVLDQLLQQAGYTVDQYGAGSNAIQIVKSAEPSSRTSGTTYSGFFRLQPTRVEATRDLTDGSQNSLRLFLDVNWEPRMRPIQIFHLLDQVRAVDENGEEIKLATDEKTQSFIVRRNSVYLEADVPLTLPHRTAQKIKTISGKFDAIVAGPSKRFVFEKLSEAAGKSQNHGEATVLVRSAEKDDTLTHVILEIEFKDADEALESHQGWIYENAMYLENQKGERLDYFGYESVSRGENKIAIDYIFELPEGPGAYRLIYETPTKITKTSAEFELNGILLP